MVRRSAFLEVGGFDARLGVGGEEELLSVDLAARGWGLAYVDEVVAHHHPSPSRDLSGRRRVQMRNALWSAWLRRPLGGAARQTAHLAALAVHQRGRRRPACSWPCSAYPGSYASAAPSPASWKPPSAPSPTELAVEDNKIWAHPSSSVECRPWSGRLRAEISMCLAGLCLRQDPERCRWPQSGRRCFRLHPSAADRIQSGIS